MQLKEYIHNIESDLSSFTETFLKALEPFKSIYFDRIEILKSEILFFEANFFDFNDDLFFNLSIKIKPLDSNYAEAFVKKALDSGKYSEENKVQDLNYDFDIELETPSYIGMEEIKKISYLLPKFKKNIYSELIGEPQIYNAQIVKIEPQNNDLNRNNNNSFQKNSATIETFQKETSSIKKGESPKFRPSLAEIPIGFNGTNKIFDDLKYALFNPTNSIQSFFNKLELVSANNSTPTLNDEVLNLPPFDESTYCQIVKEMHKFSIAELRDSQQEKSSVKSKFGAIAGGLLGVLQMNPFAPFIGASVGSNIGKTSSTYSKKIDEILPDPKLLFLKDNFSYLSIGRSQSPKTRRLIFAPIKKDDQKIYFRAIPAIVTLDFVLPMQVFEMERNQYFLRPMCAGIERNQENYDAIKIHRKYFHSRLGDGATNDTGERIRVIGPDIEDINYKLYSYESDSQDLAYLYFDYIKQPGYVY